MAGRKPTRSRPRCLGQTQTTLLVETVSRTATTVRDPRPTERRTAAVTFHRLGLVKVLDFCRGFGFPSAKHPFLVLPLFVGLPDGEAGPDSPELSTISGRRHPREK